MTLNIFFIFLFPLSSFCHIFPYVCDLMEGHGFHKFLCLHHCWILFLTYSWPFLFPPFNFCFNVSLLGYCVNFPYLRSILLKIWFCRGIVKPASRQPGVHALYCSLHFLIKSSAFYWSIALYQSIFRCHLPVYCQLGDIVLGDSSS